MDHLIPIHKLFQSSFYIYHTPSGDHLVLTSKVGVQVIYCCSVNAFWWVAQNFTFLLQQCYHYQYHFHECGIPALVLTNQFIGSLVIVAFYQIIRILFWLRDLPFKQSFRDSKTGILLSSWVLRGFPSWNCQILLPEFAYILLNAFGI